MRARTLLLNTSGSGSKRSKKRSSMDRATIDYYNRNADAYYWATVAVDLDAVRKQFASYLPPEARVIDLGCGSGRDVMAFADMGHDAVGLDASAELVRLAKERLEINAMTGDMVQWKATEPYDGIWACASLIHLTDTERKKFFGNLESNLKKGGVIFISVREGIGTGPDHEGRYMNDCSEAELRAALEAAGCEILDVRRTSDAMDRSSVHWLNVYARKTR